MRDEFHALGLAATQSGTGLAELHIRQPGIAQGFEWACDLWHCGEKRDGLFDAEVERLGDVLAAVFDIERLAIEARAAAGLTAHERGRKKAHFQFDVAGPLAFGTTALRAVEREAARGITAQPRLGNLRVKLPNMIE